MILRALSVSLGVALLAASAPALAGDLPPVPVRASTNGPPLPPLSGYFRVGGQAYLSPARTVAGLGGAVGLEAELSDHVILQADVGYLFIVGSVLSVRIAGGVQATGFWTPAALVSASMLLGDQLTFLNDRSTPVSGPAVSVGVTLCPLRFAVLGGHVSAFELGLGLGTDFPGLALAYQLNVLSVGARF